MKSYKATIFACYNGYITQAICLNLAPLLFVTFQNQFGLSYLQIGILIASNSVIELSIDLLTAKFASKMNVRFWTIFAHISTIIGLVGLSIFPFIFPSYFGLILAEVFLGFGGGLTEVMISPILQACPTEEKSGNMALLHSFYAWGASGVILLASLFFFFFPVETNWRIFPFIATIVPLLGTILFSFVPIYELPQEKEVENGQKNVNRKIFLLFLVLMFGAGATELVVSQWASTFAEESLGFSKEMGDIFGPALFAIMLGTARVFYGLFSKKLNLRKYMIFCACLCVVSYLLCAFSPIPVLSLVGCALCGFGVGIMWPGSLSFCTKTLPNCDISMFAWLALAGDVGCLIGPLLTSAFADLVGLKLSFACMLFCPILLVVLLLILKEKRNTNA